MNKQRPDDEMECFAEGCDWFGERSDAASNPADPEDWHCPRCGTRLTESES